MKKITILIILVLEVLFFQYCNNSERSVRQVDYVGSDKCQSCHQNEYSLYRQSDHFHAMDTVSQNSVLGDFDNSRFIYFGDTSRFYKKNNHYFVSTRDSTGRRREFQVSYTFGWRPLQQYLVKFTDGRIQALPFCWDTRSKENGGQRWFHIYNNDRIGGKDELFWMGIEQNWNYMCADCHTTGFKTNFSTSKNIFNSSWKFSTVSCESCHGPASNHIEWSNNKNDDPYKGFAITLAAKKMKWKLDSARQITIPESVVMNDTLIETCARCHARATRFSDHYIHGQSLMQTHIPAGVENANYYVDGQIKEEDYEYGSFLQSKMYAAGVTCINCHDAHGMKVKATGNTLCTSCHAPARFDGPQHSFHSVSGTGNQCVNCHMPETTYMVIDGRRDHSIRIPRPDLSLTNNSPNACNKCHTDRTVQWAAKNFEKWYGNHRLDTNTYVQLKEYIADLNDKSESSLFTLLSGKQYPAIIRASVMDEYGSLTSQRLFGKMVEELNSTDPLLRLNAIKGLNNYPQQDIISRIAPLLADKIIAVRMEAMNTIASSFNLLLADDQKLFRIVMAEYIRAQQHLSHRPEGFYNRAILYKAMGDLTKADQVYNLCIQRFPSFAPAYSNLADLYREQNHEVRAKAILDEGLLRVPGNPQLHYALGLWHVRSHNNKLALSELKTAADLAPGDAQMIYGYSIAMFSMEKKKEAISLLEKYTLLHGNNAMILEAIASMSTDLNMSEKAKEYNEIRKAVFGY
jgi:predicted CXXCH cytochrome family protein